ncbi:CDP-glycerol glycerophosphotransferase family protein [uncultured Friedmanniella sp.]|uniref:CDP-glycerol glycerophosphotransferase family protein n=1 Tax=uncultured Friedmanniella sp. TaxID=335381 RepID=UPI0035CA3A28
MAVKNKVSTRLARRVRRLVRRRRPTTPTPSRLAFSLDGFRATVRVQVRRRGWRLEGLVLESRQDAFSVFLPTPESDEDGWFAASFDVAELQRRHDLRGDTGDFYLQWCRPTPSDRTATEPQDQRAPEQPRPEQPRMDRRRSRLGRLDETERPPTAQHCEVDGVQVQLDVTDKGNLSLRFDHDPRTRISAVPLDYQQGPAATAVTLELNTVNAAVLQAAVVVRGRVSQERIELPATVSLMPEAIRQGWGLLRWRVVAHLDFAALAAALPEVDDIVDLNLEVLLEGAELPARVGLRLPTDLGEHQLRSTAVDQQGLSHLFIPYLTYRAHKLAFRIERLDSAHYAYLRRLLRVAWLFPLVKPFTRIWLVGEVPYKAQDNGMHFFRYLRTEHPRKRAYYVIDPTSPDREKLLPLGNVVDRFSREHIRYSLLASRLVCSHHAEYLFASRDRVVSRATRGVRIFLQHGVTATKNVTPIYARQRTYELPAERFLVCSELEQRIVVEDYGYRTRQVPITGFARFDRLFEGAEEPPERTILVMPTWRESLRPDTFLESDYFQNWHGFLASPRLQSLLAAHDLQVKLVLHPNMRIFADFFTIANVQLVRQEEADIQGLLMSSAVLVTDFSSVAWDFSFLQRPVHYFQFDHRRLVGTRAPHIDFATQLPGPLATTPDRLLADLADTVEADCRMTEEHWERARAFVDFRDRRSCERIYGAVQQAWDLGTVLDRVRNARSVQRAWWRFRTGERYFTWMGRLYAVGARLPRTPTVFFECDRGAHFGDSPRYLYERLTQRAHGLRLVWANNTTLRLTDPHTRKIARHSPRYYWELSRARYWVNNQNFPAELDKPEGTRFLQTWHGTPLKRMQHDVDNMASRDADYQVRAARLTSFWDVLLSASSYATACFRSAFRFDGTILEAGYPRNDLFSWPDADERAHATRERLGLADDPRRIILYAPTFRDDNRPGVSWKHDLQLDIARLAAELGEEFVLVVRFHQLVRQSLGSLPPEVGSFVVDGATYPDIQELLLVADVLVTDYSSVFFDYAALQRPVLFFTYDLENYRDVLRGFYLDFETSAPGPLLRDNASLIAALQDLEQVRRAYAPRLAEFAATYAPRDDGGASDRVLDAFFGEPDGRRAGRANMVPTEPRHVVRQVEDSTTSA